MLEFVLLQVKSIKSIICLFKPFSSQNQQICIYVDLPGQELTQKLQRTIKKVVFFDIFTLRKALFTESSTQLF